MIGGPDEAVSRLEPIFASLAPGVDSAARTPGREGEPTPAEHGYLHCGPSGAGHFVKMVHNGIEYGVMAAYAEGLNILQNANAGRPEREVDAETAPLDHPEHYQYEVEIPEVAELWRRGSVIGSWLLDLTARRFRSRPTSPTTRARLGLGRGTLDVDRGDRGGGAGAGAELGAVLPLRLARPRRLRRQGPVGDAQAVRRPRREGGPVKRPVGPGDGHRQPSSRRASLAAERLADAIAAGRRQGRTVHLSLAGGNTPRAAYERLAALVDDWDGVELWLGDERLVPPDDPESNYRLLAETLLAGPGRSPTPFRPTARRRRPRAPTRARSGDASRRARGRARARSRAAWPGRGRPRGLALPPRPGAGRSR